MVTILFGWALTLVTITSSTTAFATRSAIITFTRRSSSFLGLELCSIRKNQAYLATIVNFAYNHLNFFTKSEHILDSIDPIYPTEDVQADERFFVRYANHRGMITYVAGSRSLEIGNDYLGTCPYAFLIHVLALHNEFLARDHEERSANKLVDIDARVHELRDGKADEALLDSSQQLETAINDLKLDSYRKYERHRYLNIFRYDTEAEVFEKLAELRGTDWRGEAMDKALQTLEEYARDLDRPVDSLPG